MEVLGALGCMNSVDFEKKKVVNHNIVLYVFIICKKLRHIQVIKKKRYEIQHKNVTKMMTLEFCFK